MDQVLEPLVLWAVQGEALNSRVQVGPDLAIAAVEGENQTMQNVSPSLSHLLYVTVSLKQK